MVLTTFRSITGPQGVRAAHPSPNASPFSRGFSLPSSLVGDSDAC